MITPRSVGNHPPGRQARGHKVRPGVGDDRRGAPLEVQLDQRHPQNLPVRDPDRIERDVDAARLVDHRLQVLVHGLLVERVDPDRLGGSAGGNDLLGERVDRCPQAPGEKQRGPLARKARATAPPIAPPAP
jgi:hypothetical protein